MLIVLDGMGSGEASAQLLAVGCQQCTIALAESRSLWFLEYTDDAGHTG